MSENIHLLTADERKKLTQLAKGEDLFARRAQALLSVESGISQAQAGQEAGLTRDQVRYILSKFRSQRLNAFPADLVPQEPAKMLEEVTKRAKTSKKPPNQSEGTPSMDEEVDKSALEKKSFARKKIKKETLKKVGANKSSKKDKKPRLEKAKEGKKKPGKKKSPGKMSSHKKEKPKKKATKKRIK